MIEEKSQGIESTRIKTGEKNIRKSQSNLSIPFALLSVIVLSIYDFLYTFSI